MALVLKLIGGRRGTLAARAKALRRRQGACGGEQMHPEPVLRILALIGVRSLAQGGGRGTSL